MGRQRWDDDTWYDADPEHLPGRATRGGPIWGRVRAHPALAALGAVLAIALVATVLAVGIGLRNAPGDRTVASPNTVVPGGSASHSSGLATLPPHMPTHFAFGLMSAPGEVNLMNDMRSHNGTAWDFRYQYLAGGVNTGHGWETWNSPSGQFATNYLHDSITNHYIPAFVYYELRQSTGPCASCSGDGPVDLANLSNPGVMKAYYANWRLLMRMIGAAGKPALVVVEPDLWGFLQQTVVYGSNSASGITASVASSGDADAAGLPNTAQGFAWALLRIRDRYAPNALLTLHASIWSTAIDLGSSTQADLDVTGLADTTAQFLLTAGLQGNPTGISTWDLLSNDVADRDSGQGSPWWDPTNTLVPNFTRYLSYVTTLSKETGRRVVMWQVPEGNQFFDTMDDSPQHTQDNRAQYILSHVADFARAGVVAVLFGPGQGGTSASDGAHDGVTNPAPIKSYQCDRCNNHKSTYPDDDGGFLRLFVGAYYQAGPLSLANPAAWSPPKTPVVPTVAGYAAGACDFQPVAIIGKVTASPNPVAPGQRVTLSAYVTVNCTTEAMVKFDVYQGANPVAILSLSSTIANFTAAQPRMISASGIVPSGVAVGSHAIGVSVTDVAFVKVYGYALSGTQLLVS